MKIVKIGRSSSNDVNIDDKLVSRAHCQIIQDDNGEFTIIDANSLNGTFINGTKRHGQVKLNPNDIVRIGNTTLPWQSYFTPINEDTSVNGDVFPDFHGAIYCPPPVPPESKPDNFLVWAILSTLFCCLPFGICSIVHASKVDGLWNSRDYNGAREAARKARTWFWWSFGCGIVVQIIAIIYYAVLLSL